MRYIIPVLLFMMMIAVSCEHEQIPPVIVDPDPIDTTGNPTDTIPVDTTTYGVPCDPDSMYFGNDILPLLVSNCAITGCHDATTAEENIILTSYANVINTANVTPYNLDAGHLYDRITDPDEDKRMPPAPYARLTNDQINMIAVWILQGARNNFCDENAVPCDTDNVTFSATVQPIIDQKCKGCHSGNQPSGGLALTTYDQIKATGATGKLAGVINWQNGYVQMPKDASKLPNCDIEKILKWIDDGMPNN